MPRAPRQCPGKCGTRIKAEQRYCPTCTAERQWHGSGHSAQAGERALRAQVLAEEPQCRDCGKPSEVAGHIVARAHGGQYVRENLKGQCARCNAEQMVGERALSMAALRGWGEPPPRA